MIPANQIIHLSHRAFRDVDVKQLNYEKQADGIIVRVLDRGSWENVLRLSCIMEMK